MASEKMGLIYEAVTELALRKLNVKYWHNTPPAGMKIVPDFTIGNSSDSPETLIMVSHCTSEHNSDMKFWRNIGELKEAKLLKSQPVCVVVLFDAKFKANLLAIQRNSYDAFLEAEQFLSFKNCRKLLSKLSKEMPAQSPLRADWLQSKLTDGPLTELVNDIAASLIPAISSNNTQMNAFWETVRVHTNLTNSSPGRRLTYLRRGLAKALLFDRFPVESNALSFHEELGLVRRLPGGGNQFSISDMELNWFLKKFSPENRDWLIQHYSDLPEIQILKATISGLERFEVLFDAFQKAIKKCDSTTSFCKELIDSHTGVGTYKNLANDIPLKGWFVVFVISAIKAISTGDRGFGYSKIVNSLAEGNSISRGARTVEYGLRDWIYSGHRRNFSITPSELNAVGEVLFNSYQEHIGSVDLESKSSEIYSQLVRDTLETKLASHPSFLPHRDIIIKALDDYGIPWTQYRYWPSPFFQATEAKGVKLNIRSSSTEVILAKSTLIRWISVSDHGRTHKCKEFCGKGVGLRYKLSGVKWGLRSNVSKQVLVVDGTFDQGELAALAGSGWDEIFYPDEMDQLAKAIV